MRFLPIELVAKLITQRLAIAIVFLTVGYSVASAQEVRELPGCASAPACLDLIPDTIKKGNGISANESALAEAIQRFGAEPIPSLLTLLSDPNPDTRYFVAYTLRDIDGLEPSHVAPILQAAMAQNAGGWLPPALAKIGTPDAIDGLVALLRKYPQSHTQISYAFEKLGADGIPALLPLLSDHATDEDLFLAVGQIVVEIGSEANNAVLPLANIVADSAQPKETRLRALGLLGRMGSTADPARDHLMRLLAKAEGEMQMAVAGSLFQIGGSGLGDVYSLLLAPPKVPFDGVISNELDQLEFGDYDARLARVALLGERARDAVPAVLKLLNDPHPRIRVLAARTLGFIADASVGPHLVTFIHDDDWLMVRVVVESLGRVRYESARPEIALIASEHWYPPVRAVAKKALAVLEGEREYELVERSGNAYFAFDPKRFPFETPKACATVLSTPPTTSGNERFSADSHPEVAKKFEYQAEMFGYGENGIEVTTLSQPAQIGLRGPKGWFLGASRGEFGGELIWRPDGGTDQLIVRDNIEDVYELLPDKYVALAGLAHLSLDSGQIYKLERLSNRWIARWWLRLPGMPMSSWMTEGGEVVVNTTGGSVILDRSGTLRMAPCTIAEAGE